MKDAAAEKASDIAKAAKQKSQEVKEKLGGQHRDAEL